MKKKALFKGVLIATSAVVVAVVVLILVNVINGGKQKTYYDNENDSLVFSTLEVDKVFSPFFSTSATDSNVVGLTQIGMLGNDKDGNVEVIKSVKYGADLTNIPQYIKYTGFTWLGWSADASNLVEVNFANLTKDMSVYGMYKQDASPAVPFYKERLRMTYYTTDTLSSNLCSDITYQDGYTAKIVWSSSNGVILNATSGEFFMPLYDNTLDLTAHIVSYKGDVIEAEDEITFTYHVIGQYQCPTKDEIKTYLSSLFDGKIDTNLVLPKKITNEDVENAPSEYHCDHSAVFRNRRQNIQQRHNAD